MSDSDEQAIFDNSRTDKTYISPSISDHNGRKLRIANKYINGESGLQYAIEKKELVLRQTPVQRQQIKATFLVDDRSFQTLTIQKFTGRGQPKEYFTFLPSEITALLKFLGDLKRIEFPNEGKVNLTDDALEDLLLSPEQVKRLALSHPALLAEIARNEITSEDIVALAFRKKELRKFSLLLNDQAYFKQEVELNTGGPEKVWQDFFEVNSWIFGSSLSLVYFGPLDDKKLEQTVQGASMNGPGKRVDGLLRSRALVSTACFVEIKRHDTILLEETPYRTGIWRPSKELSGATAQVQGTVSTALEQWEPAEKISNPTGDPTGETIYTAEPRSYVICGRLSEFQSEHGINERKFRSFEIFRRNLVRPEIVTFDELYERARLILEANNSRAGTV